MRKNHLWMTCTCLATSCALLLVLPGCGSGSDSESASSGTSGGGAGSAGGMGSPGMGSPGMGSPGMAGGRMGSPGMGSPGMGSPGMGSPGMMSGGMMGSAGMMGGAGGRGATAVAAGGAEPADKRAPSGTRRDPFKPYWDPNPPAPVMSFLAPIRIASTRSVVPPEVAVEIRESPTSRVAGVLTGEGAYALLEGAEGTSVVRPGDSVGGYRVEAITRTSVILKRKVGNRTYTQVVPLTDVQAGASFSRRGMGGMRGGMPGGMPMTGGMTPLGSGGGGPVGGGSKMDAEF